MSVVESNVYRIIRQINEDNNAALTRILNEYNLTKGDIGIITNDNNTLEIFSYEGNNSWNPMNSYISRINSFSPALQLIRGQDEYIKNLPTQDGRLAFAVDSKKIYLDCDFKDPHGIEHKGLLSFGGNTGIYFGVKTFATDEIENNIFNFIFPDDFDSNNDENPEKDDIIINTDGCFYRVTDIEENENITIITNKLTVAGSGGGGGGTGSTIFPAKDNTKSVSFISANESMPIFLKVVDSYPETSIDVYATVQGVALNNGNAIRTNVPQGEWFVIDMWRYENTFSRNATNRIVFTFRNEYNSSAVLTVANVQLIDLKLTTPSIQLDTQRDPQFNINLYPYGTGAMDHWELYSTLHFPHGQSNDLTTHYAPTQSISNGDYFQYSVNLSSYSTGDYSYTFWLRAWPKGYENENDYLESKPIIVDFIYQSQNASTAYLQFGLDDKNKTSYILNNAIPMHYSVSFRGSGNVDIRRVIRLNGEKIAENNATIEYDKQYPWTYYSENAGVYEFLIYVDAFNISASSGLITVEQGASNIPVIDTQMASLQLYLKASGKNNTDDDRDIWTYTNGATTIVGQLQDFNWSTNGWRTVDGAPALHLSNGAKLYVPYQVFGRNAFITGKTIEIDFKLSNIRDINQVWLDMANWRIADNKLNCGIVATGDKICINTRQKINYHTPEEEALINEDTRAATNGQRAYLAEDTRIHVTFTMEDNSEGNNRLIYTYVNGVMSGAVRHAPTDSIVDDLEVDEENPINRKSFIRIDSTYADIDIFSIRIYSQFFGDNLILNNYIADLPTLAMKEEVYRNNQALTSDGRNISLSLVKNLRNISYGVIIDHGTTTDKKGKEGVTDISTRGYTPNTKEDFHLVDFYYVDPNDPSRCIGVTYTEDGNQLIDPVQAVIYAQGTSSLQYPVKNLRMRFTKTKYSLKPAIPVGEKEDAATVAERWAHLPKVALFTFKADYMDSSMSHNTGIGNILSALYNSVGLKTPAQEYYSDKTIVNNILGTPCILFYQADDDNTTDPQFIGRYNFDTDKDSKDDKALFGLMEDKTGRFGVLTDDNNQNLKYGFIGTIDEEYDNTKRYYLQPIYVEGKMTDDEDPDRTHPYQYKGGSAGWKQQTYYEGPLYEYVQGPSTIQCWEFLNNPSDLCKFQVAWDEEADKMTRWTKTSKGKTKEFSMANWCSSFESRYPVYDTEVMSDKRAWLRVINWLVSVNQATATNDILITPMYGYTIDSKAYRLEKFKQEFDNYFVKDFCTFYYVLTEALLMVDSRAKNMMMTCFDADPDNPDETKRGHWMPWFYDMDTSLGVDNSGILKFAYDTDDDNENYAFNAKANYGYYDSEGNWIPTNDYSVLWANFREAFYTDIASMYNSLRSEGKLTYDYISRSLDNSIATKFAEIYDNMDAKWKYIRPLTEETIVMDPTDGKMIPKIGVDWIHATQGTRALHRKYFLNHRFAMLDSKYPRYIESGKDSGITFRLEGTQTKFQLTSSSTQYGVVYIGNNIPIVKLEPNVPTWTGEGTMSSTGNLETYIFNLGDIYDIGPLAETKPSTLNFNVPNKIRSIRLGQTDVSRDIWWAKNCGLGGLENVPLLELLDLRNVKLSEPSVNLIHNAYLRDVYAKGSNVTSFAFVNGGTLRHIELPATYQALYIAGHLTLDTKTDPNNIQFEDITALRDLAIEASPQIDTLAIINELMRNNVVLSHIRLPDIDWTIDINEDTCEFDANGHIIDIKALQYIKRFPGLTAPKADGSYEQIYSQQGNLFFAGRVKLNNGTGVNGIGVDTYTLNKEYALVYPQLKIEYDENPNNIQGYRINVRPAGAMQGSQELVTNTTGKENSTTKSAEEILALDWRDYLANHIDYPAKEKDGQWIYTFKGWSHTSSVMSDVESEIIAVLDIPITVINETEMDASAANEHLTLSDFNENNTLELYPVYLKTLRQFLVRFYKVSLEDYTPPAGETPDTPVLDDPQINAYYYVTWGTAAPIPGNEPAIITLDQNDKSKTTIRRMNSYDYSPGPITRITSNAQYFPIWNEEAEDMSTMTNPSIGYFDIQEPQAQSINAITNTFKDDNEQDILIENGIEAIIKEEVDVEALCVPKMINDQYVVSIRNRSPKVKRIYFEQGSVIKYISGQAGFNGSIFRQKFAAGDNNYNYNYNDITQTYEYVGENEGQYVQVFEGFVKNGANTQLEYIDLGALEQLEVLGGGPHCDSIITSNDRVFCMCPNLYITTLPNTIRYITDYTFYNDSMISISAIPTDILFIGSFAFTKCKKLQDVYLKFYNYNNTILSDIVRDYNKNLIENDINSIKNLSAQWPLIGNSAFQDCNNLNFYELDNENNHISTNFQGLATIGPSAFSGCTALTWPNDRQSNINDSIQYIGANAFNGCNKLVLRNLPTDLRVLEGGAFANINNSTLSSSLLLSTFPGSLRKVGSLVFQNTSIAGNYSSMLRWICPATLIDGKSVLDVHQQALQGSGIVGLQFDFSTSVVTEEFKNTYMGIDPWAIAYNPDTKAFGAGTNVDVSAYFKE